MNILLIAIDTLRADHLGCYGYARNTSPNMDAFAREAVQFDTAFAAAIPTHPAFATINTGQYSVSHGVVSHGSSAPIPRNVPWLPAILQQNGYTTCAVDNLAEWRHGFGRGFEFYVDPTRRRALSINCDNRTLNRRAIPWLKQHAHEQFYLFVHYWDPHTPYLPPRAYRRLFYEGTPNQPDNHLLDAMDRHPLGQTWRETWFNKLGPHITDPEYIVALYDGEVRYCDEGIGQLLRALDETGRRDDTLIVILGDHGELMYRHGIFFDHHGLYDGNLHVPWLLRHPEVAPQRAPGLAAHVDVAPTILELCGIEIPEAMEGTSWAKHLLGKAPVPDRDFIVSQECTWQMKWSIRTRTHKFILAREEDFYGTPMRELYDLRSDPDELHNIAEAEPELAADLERRLEDWIADRMQNAGLTVDPLVSHGLTLGSRWKGEGDAQSAPPIGVDHR